MRSETKVGVVAGFVIVVVASVYFHGRDRTEDDFFEARTRASAPSAIPVADAGAADSTGAPAIDEPTPLESSVEATASTERRDDEPGTLGDADGTDDRFAASSDTSVWTPDAVESTAPPMRGALPPVGGTVPLRTGPSAALVQAVEARNGRTAAGSESAIASDDLADIGAAIRRMTDVDAPAAAPTSSWEAPSTGPRAAEPRPFVGTAGPVADETRTESSDIVAPPRLTAETPAAAWPREHVIEDGDSLYRLAIDYYDDPRGVEWIREANPQVTDPRRMKLGVVLTIPAPPAAGDASGASPEAVSASASGTDGAGRRAAPSTYEVRDGESFYSIAQSVYGDGRQWKKLFEANRALVRNNPRRLRGGMVIEVPRTP